jgi:hypothetical protein
MWYVIAVLLTATIYLLYRDSIFTKEQNWQNDLLNELDKDLKRLEVLNDVNIKLDE